MPQEEKALLNEAFELIALIYNEVLKLAYELVTIDVEKYIDKQRKNKKMLKRLKRNILKK